MRGFFVLLLLSNALFFGWQVWFGSESEPVNTQLPPLPGEQLVLLSELAPSERPADKADVGSNNEEEKGSVPDVVDTVAVAQEAVTIASEDDPVPAEAEQELGEEGALRCYISRPLASEADARSLRSRLKSVGFGAESRTVQMRKTNYWVMLPPYKSRDKAMEAARLLEQNNVKDFFIVRSGQHENALSLGVFSTQDRAQARYREIRGYRLKLSSPRIEALELPAKRYQVVLEGVTEEKGAALQKLRDESDKVLLKVGPCAQ